MGKSYSGLFPTTSGGRAATATPASSGKMAGIKVSLPIGTYDTGIKVHKQNEHIPGTKEFIKGKSEIHIPINDLQNLINSKAGTGSFIPKSTKERVDFGTYIGEWVNVKTGESFSTTKGLIIYSKTGTHVVPVRP